MLVDKSQSQCGVSFEEAYLGEEVLYLWKMQASFLKGGGRLLFAAVCWRATMPIHRASLISAVSIAFASGSEMKSRERKGAALTQCRACRHKIRRRQNLMWTCREFQLRPIVSEEYHNQWERKRLARRCRSMALRKIFAHLSCADLKKSAAWFEQLFGRQPDARPMEHLAEWHHGSEAGFQLFQNPPHAGKGTLTLIVSDLEVERGRLASLKPGELERGNYVNLIRLSDPDNNLVVLAEPRGSE
jgi:hypothetical protein